MGVGLIMIFVFLSILYSHHWVVVSFVVMLQVMSFRELIGVRYKEVKEQQLPYFRTLSWLAFAICEFAAYGIPVLRALNLEIVEPYHMFITFASFTLYFAMFVLSLKKKKLYKYQMTQMAWTWLVLLLVVGQAWGAWFNIFRGGIFWFLLPTGIIICNDIWAYFSGLMFGRKLTSRPFLPALSPNKTWEGFIGGFIMTLFFMPIQVYLYQLPDFWACPYSHMDSTFHCIRPDIFNWSVYELPVFLHPLLGTSIPYVPVYVHGFVFAVFGSLVAPFGGFFASGVKRAFGKKDFDSLFPGHGGFVDRMDCQMIMQLFVYIYLRTWVFPYPYSVDKVLGILSSMTSEQRRLVLEGLNKMISSI